MRWDHYDYKIASHYLPALINGDYSGLDDGEETTLDIWQMLAHRDAIAAGFTVGHWECDNEAADDCGACAVSGLLAMRQSVRLMVYKSA